VWVRAQEKNCRRKERRCRSIKRSWRQTRGRKRRMAKRDDGDGGRKVEERRSRKGKDVCAGKEEMWKW
jgi:hypothetical protein